MSSRIRTRVPLKFTAEQLAAATAGFVEINRQLDALTTMTPEEKRSNPTMAAGSESFCRNAVHIMEQDPRTVPPTVVAVESREDLVAREQLTPLVLLAAGTYARLADTHHLAGARVLNAALQCYAHLKRVGPQIGLGHLVQELAPRFARGKRKPATTSETTG
jgi:hypothetical protein